MLQICLRCQFNAIRGLTFQTWYQELYKLIHSVRVRIAEILTRKLVLTFDIWKHPILLHKRSALQAHPEYDLVALQIN